MDTLISQTITQLPMKMENCQCIFEPKSDCIYIFGSKDNEICYKFKNGKYTQITKYPNNIKPFNHTISGFYNKNNELIIVSFDSNHLMSFNTENNNWINFNNKIKNISVYSKSIAIKNESNETEIHIPACFHWLYYPASNF